jgi:tetratricopeptide (TPR) repeat protein
MNLLLAMALAAAQAGSDPAAAATAPQIEKLIQDGKADDALQQGRVAVAAHPDNVDLRLALARALAAKARRIKHQVNLAMTQADVDRGQMVLKDADLAGAPARVEYDPAFFEEALLHLGFAIEHAPRREDLRVFQCFLLTDYGRISRAKAAIESALVALPKTPALAKTMTAYGAERAKRGDPAGGAALLAPVVKAFPDQAPIWIDYANVLTRLGRKAEAYAAFDRATTLAPKEAGYARTKAVGAMLLRDFRRAQTAFDAAFRIGRGIADEFASCAAAYGIDPKAAASLMRTLGTPAPSSDPALTDLASKFARAGAKGPASQEAMTLARELVHSEQYVFAIPVLDRAIKAAPKNAEAKSLMSATYRGLGCETLAK